MRFSISGPLVLTLFAVALAGCQSSRLGSLGGRSEPLNPAPAGTVTAGQLPPPAPTGPTDPSSFPQPPSTGTKTGETDVAALDPNAPAELPGAPATATDLTVGSVAGVWNASVSGQSCRVATPQTKFGQGFRAGPLRCPSPLDGVKSWNVAGKQLSLYDANGAVLARLYSSGAERFDGQMTSGQPISLSR